jgi:hypothetical protein
MKSYAGVVYTPDAESQLEVLADEDIRYQLEPEQNEWLIQRDPEGVGTLKEISGEPVYIFLTQAKKNGPRRLAITYRIVTDARHFIQIIDVRALP